MSKNRYSIRIDGKVQGVWFRKHTAELAESLGLKGYVENEPGGSVYVEAEGEEEKLTALVSSCLNGPENAVVSGVTVVKIPTVGFQKFEIR